MCTYLGHHQVELGEGGLQQGAGEQGQVDQENHPGSQEVEEVEEKLKVLVSNTKIYTMSY